MLLLEESGSRLRNRGGLGKWRLEPWLPTAKNASIQEGNQIGGDGDCQICTAAGDILCRLAGVGGQMGGFSHESEHDLALMVSDFLENGSFDADSICSSDSDSGLLDFAHLADKISFHKHDTDQFESDLYAIVSSILLSLTKTELVLVDAGPCSASCIRQALVNRLRFAGYDAAVCTSKWDGLGNVPGGDHEYIDVNPSQGKGCSDDRLIIDIDFRSHFEIARAVEPYAALLNSLPVVYVGSLAKLEQLLPVMAEAARSSLMQNSMPLPPWRSLAYLQAKWQSPYQRKLLPDRECEGINNDGAMSSDHHKQCMGHLRALRSSLQGEVEGDRQLSKPATREKSRRLKLDRWRNRSRTFVVDGHV